MFNLEKIQKDKNLCLASVTNMSILVIVLYVNYFGFEVFSVRHR